jgi:hypothetical protein
MKKIIVCLCIVVLCISCQEKVKVETPAEKFAAFGDSISKEGAISQGEMFAKYAGLKQGDTIEVKFKSKINNVCQKKGCWMNLEMPNEEEVFVKFKDYAFFMPLNAKDEEVIVNGKAFISVESIDELKHYAKDAGKSQVAIDSINQPKTTYSFLADGVLIKE